jgi:hypothetical protein
MPDSVHRIIIPKLVYLLASQFDNPNQIMMLVGLMLNATLFFLYYRKFFEPLLKTKEESWLAVLILFFYFSWVSADIFFVGLSFAWTFCHLMFFLGLESLQKRKYKTFFFYLFLNMLNLGTWVFSIPVYLFVLLKKYLKQPSREFSVVALIVTLVSTLFYFVSHVPLDPSEVRAPLTVVSFLGFFIATIGGPFKPHGGDVVFLFGIFFFVLLIKALKQHKKLDAILSLNHMLYGLVCALGVSYGRGGGWVAFEATAGRYVSFMVFSWLALAMTFWINSEAKSKTRNFIICILIIVNLTTLSREIPHQFEVAKRCDKAGRLILTNIDIPISEISESDKSDMLFVYPDLEKLMTIAKRTRRELSNILSKELHP